MDKNIMEYEKVLPADFDGTFRFSNWSDEDFVGKWGSKEYVFPANTTSPMVIPDQSPLEVQQIRKKFAKDLAEREFFKSSQYETLLKQERNPDGTARLNSIHGGGAYSLDMLVPFIQRALEPLPVAKATVRQVVKPNLEEKLSRDDSGELNTIAVTKDGDLIEEKKSLRRKALG